MNERKTRVAGLGHLIMRFLPPLLLTSPAPSIPIYTTSNPLILSFPLFQSQEGEHDTVDYRVHSLDHNEERISLWHELPLFAVDDDARPTGALNFICEMYVV